MSISNKISVSKFIFILVSFIGFIGAIITIYAFFIQQKSVELRYEILSNTNILDIKADINQFDILYDGKSLKATNENVRIITIRIINSGSTDILKNFYDENDPLGFKIKNGMLLKEPELIEASNLYLKDNLKLFADSSQQIIFSNVILESSEYFIVKVILKFTLDSSPTILPIGKVAGIKTIQVINSIEQKETESFFTMVFSGGILIQLVRGFGYSLAVIIVVLIIVVSGFTLSDFRDKKKRKRLVKYFKFDPKYNYNKMDDAIFNRFIEDDIEILYTMRRFVKDEKYLNNKYKYAQIREKRNRKSHDVITKYELGPEYYERRINRPYFVIEKMITDGLVIKEENQLIINNSMKNTLEQFMPFLKENNYKTDRKSLNVIDTEEVKSEETEN